MHVLRIFRNNGADTIKDEYQAWARETGGILFYSIDENDWSEITSGTKDWSLNGYVKAFKAMEPMKMFVGIKYEPELYTQGNPNDANGGTSSVYGTAEEYVAMWRYAHDYFAAQGVTNAVWAMDYSAMAAHEEWHALLAALWPGDQYVDWLFWNIFTYNDQRGWSFDKFLSEGYSRFLGKSGVPQEFGGKTYTVNYAQFPWGLGAWGVGTASDYRMIDEADRTAFIAGADEALNSGRYPKLQLSVYFDSQDDNSGQNCLIGNRTWRMGGDATYTPTVAEGGPSNEPLFEAYLDFVASDFFAQNDAIVCSPPPSSPLPPAPPPQPPAPPGSPPLPPSKPCASWCVPDSSDHVLCKQAWASDCHGCAACLE